MLLRPQGTGPPLDQKQMDREAIEEAGVSGVATFQCGCAFIRGPVFDLDSRLTLSAGLNRLAGRVN